MKALLYFFVSLSLFGFAVCDSAGTEKARESETKRKELAKKELDASGKGTQGGEADKSTSSDEQEKPKVDKDSKPDKPSGEKVESIYTDLQGSKCKEQTGEGDVVLFECPGVGGYKLEVAEHDARKSINVKIPSGQFRNLDFQAVKGAGMSTLGKKAEWRVKRVNGQIKPIALITRYNVFIKPGESDKVRSYLIVTKIDGDTVCVTDVIDPVKNANVKARKAADIAISNPCRSGGA